MMLYSIEMVIIAGTIDNNSFFECYYFVTY